MAFDTLRPFLSRISLRFLVASNLSFFFDCFCSATLVRTSDLFPPSKFSGGPGICTRISLPCYTIPPKIYAVNYKLFWEYLRYAVTVFSSETMILFMQLHLPYFFLVFFSIFMCSLQKFGNYLFMCSRSSGGFQNKFLISCWEDGTNMLKIIVFW